MPNDRLTFSQCITRLKEDYPGMYPTYWIEYKGVYIFSIAERGVRSDLANADFHLVNPDNGNVSGSIPIDKLLQDKQISYLLQHPNKVDPADQVVEHKLKICSPLSILDKGEYLCHHGIKGQKWGVRRFQNKDGTLTEEGKERYGYGFSKSGKKIEEPAGVVAELATLAAFTIGSAVYSHVKRNSRHKKFKEQNDNLSEDYLSDISVMKDFSNENKPKLINKEHSIEDDMTAVNPKYGENLSGATNNCVLCSVTYDLRRRGYDVNSKLCSTGMYTSKVIAEMYENAGRLDDVSGANWSKVYKNCEKKYPEGSRGLIAVSGIFGAHAMAFEMHNGKMEVIDAQSGNRRKLTDSSLSIFTPQYTQAIRLDDKNVKWEGANIACMELKSDWRGIIKNNKNKKSVVEQERHKKDDNKIAAGSRSFIETKQILAYKKEHPNSKLTDKEILIAVNGD